MKAYYWSPFLLPINYNYLVKKKLISALVYTIIGPLFWLYVRMVMWFSKVERIGESKVDELPENQTGRIYVFWHNQQILMPNIKPEKNFHALVSSSRDGNYMAWLVRLSGNTPVRGSSSKGGVKALKQMMRLLRAGKELAIATDGPRGPAFKVKPGVVQLAQSTGAPVIPVAYCASKKKQFSSWDKSFLPYFFGRIVIVFGDPIYLDRSVSLDAGIAEVQRGLDQVNHLAQESITS